MKCSKCGQEMREKDIIMGENKYGDPIYNRYAFCDRCKIKKNIEKTLSSGASVDIIPKASKKPAKQPVPTQNAPKPQKQKRSGGCLNTLIVLFAILILLMIAFIALYLNKSKIPFFNKFVSKHVPTASVDTRLNVPTSKMRHGGLAYEDLPTFEI
ncbi:MAG: hypothetical protein RR869_00230 [Lachnospiraceae bacterium]